VEAGEVKAWLVTFLVLAALVLAAGCGQGDDEVPTERGSGGTLPTEDNPEDMTAAEHADAACDEVDEIRQAIARGDVRIHGDQLDYIISHTAAADNEALDEAANDWAHGIADGDAEAVDDAGVRLVELCDL
jgi:hypothetical protein